MKVGDLVKVKPALVGHYLVVSKSHKEGCWVLCGTPNSNFPMQRAAMHEKFIKVISEGCEQKES